MSSLSEPPFISAKTLCLLYPQLESLLDSIPSCEKDGVRLYNAFVALDVVNAYYPRVTTDKEAESKQPHA
jgi:hypothetical protein